VEGGVSFLDKRKKSGSGKRKIKQMARRKRKNQRDPLKGGNEES
jgi:hypothetical protein